MTGRGVLRWVLALAYAGAGVVHLVRPEGFLPIVPDWVLYPREVVLATGVAEILGAVGLLVPRVRWWAGVGLAAYAICVFPANIKHALDGVVLGGTALGWGYHGPRLAFQPVLVWAALWVGGVVAWPFGRERGRAEAGRG